MELQSFWTDSSKILTPFVTVAMFDKPSCFHTTHHVLTQWKIHCGAKWKLTMCRQTRQSRLLLVWIVIFYFLGNKYRFVARNCTPFFRFRSTKVNILSCLVCLWGKNGRFSVMIGQIACQSNPLRRINWALPMARVWGQECLFSRVTMQRN